MPWGRANREGNVRVTVRLHARAADLAGTRETAADVDARATCADVKRALVRLHPALEGLVRSSVLATDREYLADGSRPGDGAALHLIPPVSGG
jgi:molybdopterin converting factor small subunit